MLHRGKYSRIPKKNSILNLIRSVEWKRYVGIDFLKFRMYLRGYSKIFLHENIFTLPIHHFLCIIIFKKTFFRKDLDQFNEETVEVESGQD
jgi:hypothetical protein